MQNITTHEGRVIYPNLFESKAVEIAGKVKINEKTGKPEKRYNVTLLFPKGSEAVEQLKKVILEEAHKVFGPVLPPKFLNPLKDGDENFVKGTTNVKPQFKGQAFIQFAMVDDGFRRPRVVTSDYQEVLDPSVVYGGCYARVNCNAKAYDNASKGVSFYLDSVMKTRDGESFGTVRPELEHAFGAPTSAGSENPANYAKTGKDLFGGL